MALTKQQSLYADARAPLTHGRQKAGTRNSKALPSPAGPRFAVRPQMTAKLCAKLSANNWGMGNH